jgi:hypothetical protein
VWKEKFLVQLEADYKELSAKSDPSAQNLKAELKHLEEKQTRLLDAYLEKTITNEEYIAAKEKIINRKVEIKEAMSDFGRKGNNWLEPFKEWILTAHQATGKAVTGNLEEKRMFLQKIGSNFRIAGQKVACQLQIPWDFSAKKLTNSVWSCLYRQVRTYFEENAAK